LHGSSTNRRPGRTRGGPVLTALAALAVLIAGSPGSRAAAQTSLAPFVATPPEVVTRMLSLARVTPADVVYDLGSGDGRIVIEAARSFGARGVGIEIDGGLVAKSIEAARTAGLADRVSFRHQDVMTADISEATVVTLYLLSASNVRLRPLLMNQLRAGTRIVAHNFGIGDWEPDRVETFVDAGGGTRTLYLWTVRK